MMLVTVLLLGALLVSDVAAHVALNGTLENGQPETETDQDQDLEKHGPHGLECCCNGRFYFGYYYQFVRQRKSWIDAELYCQALVPGGHLASIHSREQNKFIVKLIFAKDATGPYTWLGLNDMYKEGTFLWTDGSASDFTNWDQGEPNNEGGSEDCVHTLTSEGFWNDMSCADKLPFVCSYKLGCS